MNHVEQEDHRAIREGVGAVVPGDKITGRVEGVAEVSLNIGPAE